MARIGTRLELDIDGFWNALAASFPEKFKVRPWIFICTCTHIPCPACMATSALSAHVLPAQPCSFAAAAAARASPISYPCVVLNGMEMSIEIEVDGP